MNTGFHRLLLIPTAGLLLGVAAGWLAPESDGKANPQRAAISDKPTTPRDSDRSDAPSPAALDNYERRLAECLDVDSGPCSGERLRALCLHESAAAPSAYARRWARQNPAAMFEWFQSQVGGFSLQGKILPHSFAHVLFRIWTKSDPDAALEAALGLPKTGSRTEAFFCVLNELRVSDLPRAESLLVKHADMLDPEDSPWVLNDDRFGFEAHVAFIQHLPPGEQRARVLAERFDDAGLPEAREMWSSASDDLRRELAAGGYRPEKPIVIDEANPPFDPFAERTLLNSALADGFDGLDALLRENAERTGKLDDAAGFLRLCGADWASRDLAGAFDWAQNFLHGEKRVDMQAQLFEAAAAGDFDAARAFWETLPPSTLRAWAAAHLAAGAPPHRRAEADALIESLPRRDVMRIRRRVDPFAAPFWNPEAVPADPFKASLPQ